MEKSSRTSSIRGAVTTAAAAPAQAAQAPAPATEDLRGALLSRQQSDGALSSPRCQINDTHVRVIIISGAVTLKKRLSSTYENDTHI